MGLAPSALRGNGTANWLQILTCSHTPTFRRTPVIVEPLAIASSCYHTAVYNLDEVCQRYLAIMDTVSTPPRHHTPLVTHGGAPVRIAFTGDDTPLVTHGGAPVRIAFTGDALDSTPGYLQPNVPGMIEQGLRPRAADAARYVRTRKNTTKFLKGAEKRDSGLVQVAI